MRVKNTYTKIRDDWFSWTVQIEGTDKELEEIDHVIYILHETFSPSEVVSSNPQNNFARDLQGWGEFILEAEIVMKDNKVKYAKLWVDLGFNNVEKNQETYNGNIA